MPARFQVDDADYGRLREAVSSSRAARWCATRRPRASRGAGAAGAAALRRAAAASRGAARARRLLPADRAPDAARPRDRGPRPRGLHPRAGRCKRAMVFNSLHFVWFFLVVYALYRRAAASRPELAAARRQLLLLRGLGLSLPRRCSPPRRWSTTRCGLALGADDGRAGAGAVVLWLSIGFNLAMLGFFKYFNFFADNLHALFAAMGWQLDFVTLRVLLPIGISFYTFVTMSYVIDVYRREIEPTRNLVDFAVFVAYFPHLVAGPILRATALLPQIAGPRRVTARAGARRALADRVGLLPEDLRRRQPGADSRRSVFAPDARPHGRQRPARHLRLRLPDLRRLRGLLEHRARDVEADGDRADRELPVPVSRAHAAGVLAPLAHQPLDLAARLSLHAARRQPGDGVADAAQPADHDAARRACGTARRGRSSCGASTRALLLIVYRAASTTASVRRAGSDAARRASPRGS